MLTVATILGYRPDRSYRWLLVIAWERTVSTEVERFAAVLRPAGR
jgi:hypothetical protein